jgi:hypothetical protein
MSNLLNPFPKPRQPAVAAGLREPCHARTRAAALAAIETFKGLCCTNRLGGFIL